jgi:MFS family permease
MLIGGRTVQGLGAGGIFMMADLIICDLVPIRERAKYMGMVMSTAVIGTAIGPVVGGGLAQANWRLVFWINLPISIPALIVLFFFLKLKYKREPTWKAALLRVDWLGNAIFIPSILAILLGIVMGGTTYPWISWHIIVPIVLGALGWVLVHVHQASSICKELSVPPLLFSNRTSCIAFILASISSMILNWTAYFLPFYFQASLGSSPVLSGVDVLPLNLFMVPSAMVAGGLLSKFGEYKPFHWVGFGLCSLSAGLLSTLDSHSSQAEWVIFQILGAIGLGLVLTTVLPAILAMLAEADSAVATGTFSFLRSFGYTFGVTIPSIVFNSRFDQLSHRISDPTVRMQLGEGAAYGYSSSGLILELPIKVQREVRDIYSYAIKTTWQVALAFFLLGFLLVVFEKHVELRTNLETEFGLDDGKKIQEIDNGEASKAHADGTRLWEIQAKPGVGLNIMLADPRMGNGPNRLDAQHTPPIPICHLKIYDAIGIWLKSRGCYSNIDGWTIQYVSSSILMSKILIRYKRNSLSISVSFQKSNNFQLPCGPASKNLLSDIQQCTTLHIEVADCINTICIKAATDRQNAQI